VKTTSVGGLRGYEGAKKLSGRKRHLLVDTLRMVLKALGCTRRTCRTGLRCRWCWRERPKSSPAWSTSQAMIHAVMSRLMLRRLARA
jgi:hypothetical protein